MKESDQFIAVYNAAIASRLLGHYDRAISEFMKALSIVHPRNVSIFEVHNYLY